MSFIDGKKVYLFCLLVMAGIPLVHFYYRPLNLEFMIFMECLYAYFFLNRSTQAKIHGHRMGKYL